MKVLKTLMQFLLAVTLNSILLAQTTDKPSDKESEKERELQIQREFEERIGQRRWTFFLGSYGRGNRFDDEAREQTSVALAYNLFPKGNFGLWVYGQEAFHEDIDFFASGIRRQRLLLRSLSLEVVISDRTKRFFGGFGVGRARARVDDSSLIGVSNIDNLFGIHLGYNINENAFYRIRSQWSGTNNQFRSAYVALGFEIGLRF